MEMTKNWHSKEVKPSFGVFRGRWALLLMGSCLGAVLFSFWGISAGLDLASTLSVTAILFILPAIFVVLFVNGKPTTYIPDLYKLYRFKILTLLYMKGFLDRPPYLWVKRKTPPYPR